jgi:hypothetical protein
MKEVNMKGITATFTFENITLIITDKADARLARIAVDQFKKRGETK